MVVFLAHELHVCVCKWGGALSHHIMPRRRRTRPSPECPLSFFYLSVSFVLASLSVLLSFLLACLLTAHTFSCFSPPLSFSLAYFVIVSSTLCLSLSFPPAHSVIFLSLRYSSTIHLFSSFSLIPFLFLSQLTSLCSSYLLYL